MRYLLLGAAAGLTISVLYYLLMSIVDRKHVSSLGAYFFYGWSLSERTVTVSQFSSSMSLATVVIALLQLGVIFGVGLSWATLTFCLGWVFFVLMVPLIRRHTVPRDTIHSFLGRRYESDAVRVLAAIATIAGFLGLFATELFAADVVLSALNVNPHFVGGAIVLFALVTIAYSAVGGFRSVVRSDWSQTALLLAALAILALLGLRNWLAADQPSVMATQQAHSWILPLIVATGLFFINVPYPLVDTQSWQRARAAATDSAAKMGTAKAIWMFVATWSFMIGLAILVATTLTPGENPFKSIVQSATTLSPLAAFLVGCILIPGLAAAMFSSADAFVNSAAHVYSLDISALRTKADSDNVTSTARLHVVILGLGGLAVTMLLRFAGFGIVDMVFAVSAGQLALLPSVLCGLFAPHTKGIKKLRVPALASIGLGFAAAWVNGLYSVMTGLQHHVPSSLSQIFPPDVYRSPAYAIITSFFVFLVGTLLAVLWPSTRSEVRL